MSTLKNLLKAVLPERVLLHLQALDHHWHGEPELRLVAKLCPPRRDAIDAGANIGTYSYFLRRHARRVVAYEPNPGLAKRLTRLMPDITVRNVALSDRPGRVVLRVPVDASGKDQHELASIAQDFVCATRDFAVESITIDSENFDNVGFLKVDVEQHEREVLRGALQTIQRCRPVVMTEMAPLRYDHDVPEIFGFVTECDYVGWFRFGTEWLPLASFKGPVHANPQSFGTSQLFAGSNLFLFPAEHRLAKAGPLG